MIFFLKLTADLEFSAGSLHFLLISMHVEVPIRDATIVRSGKNKNSFGTPMDFA